MLFTFMSDLNSKFFRIWINFGFRFLEIHSNNFAYLEWDKILNGLVTLQDSHSRTTKYNDEIRVFLVRKHGIRKGKFFYFLSH